MARLRGRGGGGGGVGTVDADVADDAAATSAGGGGTPASECDGGNVCGGRGPNFAFTELIAFVLNASTHDMR